MECDQGDLGRLLGSPCWRVTKTVCLLKRMEEAVDGDYQSYKAHGGAFVREHFFR